MRTFYFMLERLKSKTLSFSDQVDYSRTNSVGSRPISVNVDEGAQELDLQRNFDNIECVAEWREFSVTARHACTILRWKKNH